METRQTGWRRVGPGIRPAEREPSPPLEPAAEEKEPSSTFITPACDFDGRLVLDRSMQIDCAFRGAIQSAQTVTVGPDAAIEATIEARTVIVHGAVAGDIRGSREVVLHPTARLQGSVETPCFVIERGAVFNGQTRMYRPEQAARARAELEADAAPARRPRTRPAPRT
jgi:cytoskeletal protein CcmA (bactofilin family)